MGQQPKPDFVNVRLSEAGRAFAGEHGQVRIVNAHLAYSFHDDQIVRVVYRGDWTMVLASEQCTGKPMFEIVADLPAAKEETD